MAKTVTRTRAPKDMSPTWDGHETLTTAEYSRKWHSAMDYYRLEFNGKDLKPAVLKWMASIGCTKEDILAFKKTNDNRCNITYGAIASNLLRGMPAQRDDFNEGRNSADWLRGRISEIIEEGKNDKVEDEDVKSFIVQPTIQERVRDAAIKMTDEIEDHLESFMKDPENFNPKLFKVQTLLKGKGAKAAHARIIKSKYIGELNELLELASGNADEQLREGYSRRSRKQIRALIEFFQEIMSACDMLSQEAKVTRKPRARKPMPKEKIVAKLKFMKTHEPLKLVSINPTDILGSKELWVYNTKTRKLGKYVAADMNTLGVKGATLIGFNETASVCKTIRKPEETLKAFKAAGKVQLRKFLDEINATDIKLTGRLNEDVILLKAS